MNRLLAFEHTSEQIRFVYTEGKFNNIKIAEDASQLPVDLKYVKLIDIYQKCEDLVAQKLSCEDFIIWQMSSINKKVLEGLQYEEEDDVVNIRLLSEVEEA